MQDHSGILQKICMHGFAGRRLNRVTAPALVCQVVSGFLYRAYCFMNVMNEASLLLTLEKLKDAMWIDALKCMFADESALVAALSHDPWLFLQGMDCG